MRIEWDNGKNTILLTSLQSDTIGASLVVKKYFDRWPLEELTFRSMKAFVSLHRVAGYGKQLIEDTAVREKQEKLKSKIKGLKEVLKEPLEHISQETELLSESIRMERTIRIRSSIKDGKRTLGNDDLESLKKCEKEIQILS